MTLSAGTRLGPYEVLAPIGAGGMGEVYRARDKKLDRDVAIKVLPDSVATDPAALARFEREAKAVAALSHPNILAIHDFGTHEGISYAVMELLEGETLRERLGEGPIPQKQAVDYALQVARGLSAAHQKGVIHRDLKPENLFVVKGGHIKILDFGLAKRVEVIAPGEETQVPTASQYTEPGAVMGTVGYMSPEQVCGLPVDFRSDVFSFGAILYELLSGRRAFKRDTSAETISAILRDEPPDLSTSGRNIPPTLERVVRHCLEKSRDDRFESAKDIVFALSETSSPVMSGGARVAARGDSKRNRLIAIVAGVVVLLGVGTVALLNGPFATTTSRTTAGPSIAVLPFMNLSEDKSQDYFSDGLSEELMGLLAKVTGLHVAGRTSSFAFKGKTEDLVSIGQKLHVATVLEGSVRRSGDQLRVSTQLVNVADGYQIWAETYDRKLTEIFAVQDEIADAVVSALKVKLLRQERSATSQHRTASMEAYNHYLLGRQFWWTRQNPEGYRLAVEAYQKAIELDPGYAAAYAGLAPATAMAAQFGSATPAERNEGRQRALTTADRAISLDPKLAEGYYARGFLLWDITWDWARAKADLERALSLDTSETRAHVTYGLVLATLGRMREAIAEERKAVEIDPLFVVPWFRLGSFLNATGQLPEARRALNRALEINPEYVWPPFHLGVTSLLEGNPGTSLHEFERSKQEDWSLSGVAMAEYALGHAVASQQALDRLIAKYAQLSAYPIAQVYAWRGEKDKAFEWLDRGYAQRDRYMNRLKFDPLLAKLRTDPRYVAMLKKMNLPIGT